MTDNNFGINVDGELGVIASGGLFGGSFKGKDNKIHGIQYYNPKTANMISQFFNEYIKSGEIETHEGMEVYIGAKIFQNSTKILSVKELFKKSHGATLILFNSESLQSELQYTIDMQYRYPIVYLLKNPNENIVPFTYPVKEESNVTDYKGYNIE